MRINPLPSFSFKSNTKCSSNPKNNVSFGWYSPYADFYGSRYNSRRIQKRRGLRNQEQERLREKQEKLREDQEKIRLEQELKKEKDLYEMKKNSIIKEIKSRLAESAQVRHVRDVQRIFGLLGLRTQTVEDNKLIVEKFQQPNEHITFENLGVDENRLFNFISRIHLDADFRNSKLSNLGKLESIGGDVLLDDMSTITPETLKNIKISGTIIKK